MAENKSLSIEQMEGMVGRKINALVISILFRAEYDEEEFKPIEDTRDKELIDLTLKKNGGDS